MLTRSTLNNARHLINVLQGIKMKMRTNNQLDKHHVVDNHINSLKTSITTYLKYCASTKDQLDEKSFAYQMDILKWASRSLQLIAKIHTANNNKMLKRSTTVSHYSNV